MALPVSFECRFTPEFLEQPRWTLGVVELRSRFGCRTPLLVLAGVVAFATMLFAEGLVSFRMRHIPSPCRASSEVYMFVHEIECFVSNS